mmetsp:Transcript_123070/g.348803  ORF Transcript_123070/g.348803 Transcript_123070/m.348803 type:complete len:225 (+) Transcript_123070:98-772(+)
MSGPCSLREGLRARRLEGGAKPFVDERPLPDDRELQLRVVHLLHMISPALRWCENCGVDDLNAPWLRTVPTCHFAVHLADSAVDGDVAVLLVHVVRVRAAVVPEPDGVVFHLCRPAIKELVHCEQLAATLLRLVELLHEVPEPRLREDDVPREQAHPVDLGRRVLRGGRGAAHDLVLVHLGLEGWVILDGLHHCSAWPQRGSLTAPRARTHAYALPLFLCLLTA